MTDVIEPTLLVVDDATRAKLHDDAARGEASLSAGVKLSALPYGELVGLCAVREMELCLLTAELARRRHAAAN